MSKSTAIVKHGLSVSTMEEMKQFALAAYCAGILGKVENQARAVAEAVVKIQYGAELGIGPMQSLQGISLIQGKPAVGGILLAAKVKSSGRYNYRVVKHTAEECEIEFYEKGKPCGNSGFTISDAKKMGVYDRNPNWKTIPKNMLFARAISNGARWYCGDAFSGPIYSSEELMDEPAIAAEPVVVLDAPPTPAPKKKKNQPNKLIAAMGVETKEEPPGPPPVDEPPPPEPGSDIEEDFI